MNAAITTLKNAIHGFEHARSFLLSAGMTDKIKINETKIAEFQAAIAVLEDAVSPCTVAAATPPQPELVDLEMVDIPEGSVVRHRGWKAGEWASILQVYAGWVYISALCAGHVGVRKSLAELRADLWQIKFPGESHYRPCSKSSKY